MTEETPRRAGYRDVWMNDPSMSFRSELRTISLVRHSGGGVRFVLVEHRQLQPPVRHEWVHITTEEQFDKLWNLLMELKE